MIDFSDLIDTANRSDFLGTIIEQKERLRRLYFLIKEMPKPPPVPKFSLWHTYQELYEFEKGERELLLELPNRGGGLKFHGISVNYNK